VKKQIPAETENPADRNELNADEALRNEGQFPLLIYKF
jgi:hypothetical protein